jgi:hypothetical protein
MTTFVAGEDCSKIGHLSKSRTGLSGQYGILIHLPTKKVDNSFVASEQLDLLPASTEA